MKLLKLSFKILQVTGFWRSVELSGWKKHFYYIYTITMIFVLYSVTLTQMIQLINYNGNINEFIYHSSILLTTINACAKIANICHKRSVILKLIDILLTKPCHPQNYHEYKIQKCYDKIIERNSLIYCTITQLAVVIGFICSIFKHVPIRNLTYNAWLPYNYHSDIITYWTTYIYQYGALVIGSLINVSYDTLIAGFMMQTCAQLEIFKYRMKQLYNIQYNMTKNYCPSSNVNIKQTIQCANERKIISKNIQHHLQIFKFAESANKIFTYTIFFQYSVSAIVICNSAHRLSNVTPFTPESFTSIGYLLCMLTQIFILCYYGNAVTYVSVNICDGIYAIDWLSLSESTKKSLLIIMTRTRRPIQFTSGHIVVLSLESFNKLLKLSYSVYNVLHHHLS